MLDEEMHYIFNSELIADACKEFVKKKPKSLKELENNQKYSLRFKKNLHHLIYLYEFNLSILIR